MTLSAPPALSRFFQTLWRGYRSLAMALRALALRLLVPQAGQGLRLYGWPKLYYPENLSIGDRTTINHGVFIDARGGVRIGADVRLSPYAVIESGFLTGPGPLRTHAHAPIVIEDRAWIATGAIILAGVTIGKNAIVAAGAVVTKNVPADSIARGVPAQCTPLSFENAQPLPEREPT